jgi:Flp pilus assembly pilin Flp
MAEYGVILALITASILAALIFFSGKVLQAIDYVNFLLG